MSSSRAAWSIASPRASCRRMRRSSRRTWAFSPGRIETEELQQMRIIKPLIAAAVLSLAASVAAADDIPVKIGVLNDRSGVYSDLAGEGSVIAARMAVEDFGADPKGIKVEIVNADHQSKPDIGLC